MVLEYEEVYVIVYARYICICMRFVFFFGGGAEVAFVADALCFEKESKKSVSFAAADFKPQLPMSLRLDCSA